MFNSQYYRLWFEWLKVCPAYIAICEGRGGSSILQAIYRDWGDIRNVRFSTWFPKHRHLFAEPVADHTVREMRIGEAAQIGFVTITIHREAPWKIVKRGVKKILAANFSTTPMYMAAKSQALYPITRKVNVAYGKRALELWKALRDNPNKKLHEIAKMVGISGDKVNQVSQVINIKKRATEIINAVEHGVFPTLLKQRKQRKR